jgi:hypothetical protein
MNREHRYAAYIGLLIGLLLPLLFLLGGCTSYTIQRGVDGCAECVSVKVLSWREFEQPEVHYARGPDSAEFDFGAASATTGNPLEAIGGIVVQQMLERYFPPPVQP